MYYVYLIRSVKYPAVTYIGFTSNLKQRLETHNKGHVSATVENRPWVLVAFVGLDSYAKAVKMERYLKSGSGHAFAKKRFW